MATAPPTAKPKPAAAKPASDKPVQPNRLRGFGAFVAREVLRLEKFRPDHSHDGFVAAIRLAMDYCGKRDWNTVDDMEEELEQQLCLALRCPPGDVSAEYVARNRESRLPRIRFLTVWGYREAVEGQLSFNLHYKPDRAATKGKG